MKFSALSPRGRGATGNPANRFERIHVALDPGIESVATQYFRDSTRQILARNDSPDIPFARSLNPYRGCEHGCSYCYARPTHEYLGMSAGLDFESRIFVKSNAPALLRRELQHPSWTPQVVALSGVTDPYQPIERHLEITRRCLEVFVEFRNPIAIVTKNALVTRDVDLLGELARHAAAVVFVSITTLDGELAGSMEPRATHPQRRLEAIERLSAAGIPVGVMVAPVVPGLTDHEIPAILKAAATHGARSAGYVALRLPHGVGDIFEAWLQSRSQERRRKVMTRIRDMREGARNESAFGVRMRGTGEFARSIEAVFSANCRRLRLKTDRRELSTAAFRRGGQQDLPFATFP